MPVRFICDECGWEVPRNRVSFEEYEGWVYSAEMTELELYSPYLCRLLCGSMKYGADRNFVYTGCYLKVIEREKLHRGVSGLDSLQRKKV